MVEKHSLSLDALNEAYKDIFGQLLRNWLDNANDDVRTYQAYGSPRDRFVTGLSLLDSLYDQALDILNADPPQ